MSEQFAYIPEAREPLSNRQVDTIRGQLHKFMLIPIMEHHTRWFDGGPVSIGVEARALGSDPDNMVRGPSIHVCNGDRSEEYIRFDVFGAVLHYHYCLPDAEHNILWGYDPDVNGPMIPWAVAALRDRLPTMLRSAGADQLASEIEQMGWDASVLADVERAATDALKARDDDFDRAKEGMAWMMDWKKVHPQFNTVDEGEY
ncbi:MAG: hypothetical protein P8J20_13615 [Novosphingobium sp.]|nr:hypothetical protein [Novosphingobium sp.]